MKPQYKYTQDNGDELVITPLRENYMVTIGDKKIYHSVVIPKRTLFDVLLKITQELADGEHPETAKIF